nr:DNA ligase [Ipomoea batatas]GME19159.1 DNA ligase [Ipomoea batatas]
MAYIPPHKRHSESSPAPELLIPQFQRNLNLRDRKSTGRSDRKGKDLGAGSKIIYADSAISKWFSVGLLDSDNEDESSSFSALTSLEPVSVEFLERKFGEKPLALVLKEDAGERETVFVDKPWVCVAENVKRDLLSSFRRVKNEMVENAREEVKPSLVARVGRILFHGNPSSLECVRRNLLTESSLRTLKKSFYTNVPPTYMEHVTDKIVQEIGLNFEEDKEIYHVKIELNQVRHMVEDISCLGKSLDLRLMLCTKRIMIALTDDEIDGIKALISSAVLDSDVKGGLRWPLGKNSSGDRYSIVGVWHTTAKTYRSSSIRLKVRHADRFDFRTSSGEVAREVTLKLHGIVSQIQDETCENDPVFQMLGDNIKLIWDHFLCSGSCI